MTINVRVSMGMTLYHAQTMKEMKINNVIEQSLDEDSAEFSEMCATYEDVTGFERESNKEEFDKLLVEELIERAKEEQKARVELIENTVRNCYYQGTTAYVTFGGYMINPKEFCAIRVDGFDIQVNKQ